jgi:hypothetical protein
LTHSIVETLPVINKPKHSKKKGGNTRKKWKEPTSKKKTKRTTNECKSHKEHQVPPEPLPVTRSISNKNIRKGPLERTLSLEEPSPTATACLKIETACPRCNYK